MTGSIGWSHAGEMVPFERFTEKQGLSHRVIYSIIQDRAGFLWISGEGGLNKFDGYQFTLFKHDPLNPNSPSSNDIGALCEDRDGIIWMATWGGGVNRFDPDSVSFRHFKHDPNDPRSLSDDRVQSIFQDSKGRLWFGTYRGGLNLMRPDQQSFIRFQNNPDDRTSLSHNRVWSICEDSAGYIWIGTSNGLNRLQPETGHIDHFMPDPADPKSICHNQVQGLHVTRDGRLWVATFDGLNVIDPLNLEAGFKCYQHDPGDPHSLSHNVTYSIFEDHAGTIWIGTNFGGINRFDPETGHFTAFEHDPANNQSLSHNDVRAIYEDRSHNLWVGTRGGGLNKTDLKPRKFIHYEYRHETPHTLSYPLVHAVFEDRDRNLWVGTDGGGLDLLPAAENTFLTAEMERFIHFQADPSDPNSLCNDRIRTIVQDTTGALWIGTYNGGLNRLNFRNNDPSQTENARFMLFYPDRNNPFSLSHYRIHSLLLDRSGTLWVGTDRGLDQLIISTKPPYYRFKHHRHDPNDSNTLSHDSVIAIHEDRAGDLWVGTWGGGLNHCVMSTDSLGHRHIERIIHYPGQPDHPNSLIHGEVQTIYEDSSEMLWIGTRGGLNKFDRATGRFTAYTERDGLPSNEIVGILEDDQHRLWLSTIKGLTRFDPVTGIFRNFDVEDGLQGNEFYRGATFENQRGEFFLGGLNGLNRFHPDHVRDNPYIPPVVLTSFRIFDREVSAGAIALHKTSVLNLDYDDSFFSFEFAALDFTQPLKNRYAYRLAGFDEGWIYSGSRRYVSYTNLDGGHYTLYVKGSNNDQIWNNVGLTLEIHIAPPFWQRWWFYLLEVAMGIGLVLLLLANQRRRLVHQKADEIRRLELQQKTQQLERARQLQLSLLPRIAPKLPQFEFGSYMNAARLVGGDYFDFIPSSDQQKTYIIIADVSGKGVPASLVMVEVRAILHTLAAYNISTRELLIHTNQQIFNDLSDMDHPMMITMLALCWDEARQELLFTGAGHEYVLIYRHHSQTCEVIESGGMWLGVEPDISRFLTENRIEILPGDAILLYTDGVTEYRSPAGQQFGHDALVEFFTDNGHRSASQIVTALTQTLEQFGERQSQYDDVTIVVIKRIKQSSG